MSRSAGPGSRPRWAMSSRSCCPTEPATSPGRCSTSTAGRTSESLPPPLGSIYMFPRVRTSLVARERREATMGLDFAPIDADNHYYEPLDAFTRYLDPKFG